MKITLNDIYLSFEIAGNGPALLLIHGFTGSSQTWQALVPALSQHRTLIMIDLVGHGASAVPSDPQRYAIEQCVSDLLALLDQLGVARTDLLGYSMGGRIGLLLTASAPERVGRQVLIGASPGLADPAERASRLASDEELAERIERGGLEWFVEFWESQSLFASQQRLPAAVREAQVMKNWPSVLSAEVWNGSLSFGNRSRCLPANSDCQPLFVKRNANNAWPVVQSATPTLYAG